MDIDARMRCSTPVEINGALPLSPPVSPIPHISEFYTSSPESSADNALISSPIPSNRIRVVSLNRLLPSVTSLQDHQVSVSSDNSSHPNHIELVPSTPLPHAPRPRRGGKAICNTCYGAYANEAINGHLPGAVMRVCGVCAAVYREENPGEQAAAAAPQNVSREDESPRNQSLSVHSEHNPDMRYFQFIPRTHYDIQAPIHETIEHLQCVAISDMQAARELVRLTFDHSAESAARFAIGELDRIVLVENPHSTDAERGVVHADFGIMLESRITRARNEIMSLRSINIMAYACKQHVMEMCSYFNDQVDNFARAFSLRQARDAAEIIGNVVAGNREVFDELEIFAEEILNLSDNTGLSAGGHDVSVGDSLIISQGEGDDEILHPPPPALAAAPPAPRNDIVRAVFPRDNIVNELLAAAGITVPDAPAREVVDIAPAGAAALDLLPGVINLEIEEAAVIPQEDGEPAPLSPAAVHRDRPLVHRRQRRLRRSFPYMMDVSITIKQKIDKK